MKILLASSSSGSRGGGELYLLYLGRALAERGHHLSLWASSHQRMDELAEKFSSIGPVLRSDYVNTYDRPGRSLETYFDRGSARRIAEEWQKTGTDFIHLNKQNLEDGLDLLRAARLSRIPNLCTIHLTQSARYLRAKVAWSRDFIARRALRSYPGKLVTVLEDRRRDLASFIGNAPSSRIRCIPNGVPLPDLKQGAETRRAKRESLRIGPEVFLVIGVGRMVPQKRPIKFLECAERIHREISKARFLWVGDGSLTSEWDRWVAERNLEDVIRRLPWQSEVASLLLAGDLFLHVAEFEGLPLAILEAMAAGLPCAIAQNLISEMPFLNANNAVSVSSDDQWVSELLDYAKLTEVGAAARSIAEKEFSFETMAARYEKEYRESMKAEGRMLK